MTEIVNAVIERVSIETERGLTAWLHLNYGGSGQAFCGHFIKRCIDIGGVSEWEKLQGKTIRVRSYVPGFRGSIEAIGHIIKDDWFFPRDDFSGFSK